jgi:glycosyltransferase involved in cell wall biosynthesis
MVPRPRLSIGFPVYNSAATVRASLEALLGQTFTDYELVVSDNASTDGTFAICSELAARDPRVQVIRQPVNRGAFENFAAVLAPARGEYFMWAAGDDDWHPRLLDICVAALDRRPDVGVVFPRAKITSLRLPYPARTDLPRLPFVEADDTFTRVCGYIEMPALSHKANAIYGLWRTGLARRAIDAIRTIDPQLARFGLDIAMMVYILTQTKMLELPEVLFDKRSKWFPIGSAADRLLTRVMHIIRPQSRRQAERAPAEHVALIRAMLERAGVMDERYEEILQRKLEQRIV